MPQLPPERVQLLDETKTGTVPTSWDQFTVPVGESPVTVAVQVVPEDPTVNVEAVHDTEVVLLEAAPVTVMAV